MHLPKYVKYLQNFRHALRSREHISHASSCSTGGSQAPRLLTRSREALWVMYSEAERGECWEFYKWSIGVSLPGAAEASVRGRQTDLRTALDLQSLISQRAPSNDERRFSTRNNARHHRRFRRSSDNLSHHNCSVSNSKRRFSVNYTKPQTFRGRYSFVCPTT